MAILANGKRIILRGLADTAVEIASRRWRCGKCFSNRDGTRTYIIYEKPIHQWNGVSWGDLAPVVQPSFRAGQLLWIHDQPRVYATTNYYGGTDDGHIIGSDNNYAGARATSTTWDTTATALTVGQWFDGSSYLVYRGYLSFDTSGIGSGAVKQANLYLRTNALNNDTNFDVRVHDYNWATPIGFGNREANYDGALASTYDALWQNTAALSVLTYYASSNLNTSWVSTGGVTRYALLSGRDVSNTAPTGLERIDLYSADASGTGSDPYLAVTVVTAPTGCGNSVIGPNQVDVAWTDTSTGEDNFYIERSDNGGSYGAVHTSAANSVSWSDTTVTPGNTYQYRVRAKVGSNYTGYSTAAANVQTWPGYAFIF